VAVLIQIGWLQRADPAKLAGMRVQLLSDPAVFSQRATPWMIEEPFSTNVIGVHVAGVVDGKRPRGDEDVWILVLDGDRVVGAAMHTPPHELFLPRLEPGIAALIAAALAEPDHALPGVNGEIAAVREFAEAWTAAMRITSTVTSSRRLYRLGSLAAPSGVPGRPRRAERGDLDLVADWFVRFDAEAHTGDIGVDWADLARRRVEAGQLWLWEDAGTTVSLAGVSEASAGVARVGPVYTPPAHRRHGYGAAITAEVSAAALRVGAEHVALYTDLANPTSNAIYQKIGYEPVHDAEVRTFEGPGSGAGPAMAR
jgi:predicted GNAT family acetyltransferase